jgi:hypothetical protein
MTVLELKTAAISTDEGIGSKESASLENDNTTDSKSEDSGHQVRNFFFLNLTDLL